MQEHMYRDKLNYFEFDLSLTKTQFATTNKMQEHVYNEKLRDVDFDLSLTINSIACRTCRSECTQTNSIILNAT